MNKVAILFVALLAALCTGSPALRAQSATAPAADPPQARAPVIAQESDDANSDPYQPKQLTPPDGDGPVRVRAGFHLLAIHGIDDEAETFKFSGILTLTWKDARQAFDPEIAGIDERYFHGAFQFNELSPGWYPQVVLANATEFDNSQGVILRVKPDGTSTLIQTITAEARSRLDLRRYPFDNQRLEADFNILGFDNDEVVLEVDSNAASADLEEIQVPQWRLTGIDTAIGSIESPFEGAEAESSVFILSLDTDRKAFFMVRLVVVPLIIIVCLSFSVFWMDRSSLGDRMAVSFVGILTAVAYQIMVSDIMPQISYMTLMNAILNFSFFVMCATVVVNLVVGARDNRGDSKGGERLDLQCRRIFPLVYAGLVAVSAVIALYWL